MSREQRNKKRQESRVERKKQHAITVEIAAVIPSRLTPPLTPRI